jgi:hypothetical protein
LPEQNSSAGDGIFYICNPFSDSGKSGWLCIKLSSLSIEKCELSSYLKT